MKREQKRITAKKKSMYLGTRNLEVKNKRIKHNNKSNDSQNINNWLYFAKH